MNVCTFLIKRVFWLMLQNSLVTALIEIILSIIEVGASVNGDYSELMYICIESLLMGPSLKISKLHVANCNLPVYIHSTSLPMNRRKTP